MRDPPDRAAGILRHQQGAVMRNGHANGSSPHLGIADDKAGHEILVFAARRAVLETDANDLVARALRPVPRAMLGGEPVTAILRGERIGVIEHKPKRGRVSLDENVGSGDLALEIGTLAGVVRIFVVPI